MLHIYSAVSVLYKWLQHKGEKIGKVDDIRGLLILKGLKSAPKSVSSTEKTKNNELTLK